MFLTSWPVHPFLSSAWNGLRKAIKPPSKSSTMQTQSLRWHSIPFQLSSNSDSDSVASKHFMYTGWNSNLNQNNRYSQGFRPIATSVRHPEKKYFQNPPIHDSKWWSPKKTKVFFDAPLKMKIWISTRDLIPVFLRNLLEVGGKKSCWYKV